MRPGNIDDDPRAYLAFFERHFQYWVRSACQEPRRGELPGEALREVPGDEFYRFVQERLGDETLNWIGWGLKAGLIVQEGHRFRVLGGRTGPFRWFSRRSSPEGWPLHSNWEAYVHVAFFVRIWQPCQDAGMNLTFEDEGMDLIARRERRMVWYVEVKYRPGGPTERLLRELPHWGDIGVDTKANPRSNDPLQKARYLVRHKPEFFSVVALSLERHFRVKYEQDNRFHLSESEPPVCPLDRPPPTQ